jgi:hypothetical protein
MPPSLRPLDKAPLSSGVEPDGRGGAMGGGARGLIIREDEAHPSFSPSSLPFVTTGCSSSPRVGRSQRGDAKAV